MQRIVRLIIFLTVAAAFFVAPARGAKPEDELIGFWGYGTAYGPMLQGEIAVEKIGAGWRATFGGLEAWAAAEGEALRFIFPERAGKFRGRLIGDRIEGFFIRLPVIEDPRYPGAGSRPFSSPVVLQRGSKYRWAGEVRPLKDRAKLYLKVFRDDQGRLLGAFRDPYRNDIGGASRFLVAREGDKVAFGLPNEAGGMDVHFTGAFAGGKIKIVWPELGGEIEMRALALDDLHMFLPRPAGAPPYMYKKPDAIDDGWQTARGRDLGIDEGALERAVRRIIAQDPADRQPSLVHAVLIARRGKLVLEEYFYGHDRETPHDIRSAGKTFASVMLGAAMLKGIEIAPESKIYEVLADRGPFANPDSRKAKITLAHLMTHTSGLACNDNDDASPGNENTMDSQTAEPDWWKYTLDLPLTHEPGTRYAYCSASINLVGGALTATTKTWLPEFFDRTVARPLAFGRYHWYLTPTEDGYLGGGAYLRPRDLLKVGQAYLDRGVWRGRRIVSAAWVKQSTAPRVKISPETTGYSEEEFANHYGLAEDAYGWHLGKMQAGARTVDTYAATGNGGQILLVAPALDLVVVFTGGNYRQGGIWSRWPDEFIGAEIAATMEP
jgi:CubicO group peptidase (beta-lactamase class C family)